MFGQDIANSERGDTELEKKAFIACVSAVEVGENAREVEYRMVERQANDLELMAAAVFSDVPTAARTLNNEKKRL